VTRTFPERAPSAVVFDLDGVLLDTEPFYTIATQEIVAEWGKVFDWSVKSRMIGRPSLESAQTLVEALGLPITPEEYLERRAARLESLFPTAVEIEGAEAFTRSLAERGIPLAVATSSERRLFELKTGRHREWFAIFDAVVVGDDPRVGRGKPAPDIFLVAAADLGVEAAGCLVFEDAPAGVRAARAAGMAVIALPDPAMDREAYGEADRVISGYADLDPLSLGWQDRGRPGSDD
jgi:pseudouridine-5'-monophosphatase